MAEARQVVGSDPAPEPDAGDRRSSADADDEIADDQVDGRRGRCRRVAEVHPGDVERVPAEFPDAEEALTTRDEALAPLEASLAGRSSGARRRAERGARPAAPQPVRAVRRRRARPRAGHPGRAATRRLAESASRTAAVAGGDGRRRARRSLDVAASWPRALGAALVEPFRQRIERSASRGRRRPRRARRAAASALPGVEGPAASTSWPRDAVLPAYGRGAFAGSRPGAPRALGRRPGRGSPAPTATTTPWPATSKGEAFPTGHRCPPAHAGLPLPAGRRLTPTPGSAADRAGRHARRR